MPKFPTSFTSNKGDHDEFRSNGSVIYKRYNPVIYGDVARSTMGVQYPITIFRSRLQLYTFPFDPCESEALVEASLSMRYASKGNFSITGAVIPKLSSALFEGVVVNTAWFDTTNTPREAFID